MTVARLATGLATMAGCVLPDKSVGNVPAKDAGTTAPPRDATTTTDGPAPRPDADATPSACAADEGVSASLGAGSCQACLASNCCANTTACAADTTCSARLACVRRCSAEDAGYFSPVCYDDCSKQYPLSVASADLETAIYACGLTSGCASCGLGTTFNCLNRFSWPAPAAGTTTITIGIRITVNDPFSITESPPVEAGTVTPCTESEIYPCPLDAGANAVAIGANGTATISLPLTGQFNTPLSWNGYYAVHAPPVEDAVIFRNRPESSNRPMPDTFPLPTPAEITAAYIQADAALPSADAAAAKVGTVTGAVEDCHSFLAIFGAGVTVSVQGHPELAVLYPDLHNHVTPGLTATTTAGEFFIPNVPQGMQTFAFTRGDAGVYATVMMFVFPGQNTTLGVWPSPAP